MGIAQVCIDTSGSHYTYDWTLTSVAVVLIYSFNIAVVGKAMLTTYGRTMSK